MGPDCVWVLDAPRVRVEHERVVALRMQIADIRRLIARVQPLRVALATSLTFAL